MTDKEKIRVEIERLISRRDEKTFLGIEKISALKEVLSFIDSMQKEPVSKDLEEAAKEWLRPQLDKSYANYGEAKMMELTHFDGYAMLDAIEFGVKWQKEKDENLIWQLSSANYEKGIEEGKKQMMKDAVDTTIAAAPIIGLHINIKCNPEQFRFGDKVKVFVMKED